MGLQKYRFDKEGELDFKNQITLYTNWMLGLTVAGLRNAITPWGRRTVYVIGEAENAFALPAATMFRGQKLTGNLRFLTSGQHENCLMFFLMKNL